MVNQLLGKKPLLVALAAFATAAAAYGGSMEVIQSSSPNAAILPDNGCLDDTNTGTAGGGITDAIVYTETGNITDVDVRVEFTTTWRSDIQSFLTYSVGGSALLSNNFDTSGDNLFATFDDEGAALCSDAANCGTGANCVSAPGPTCQPIQPLTPFDGLSGTGTWTLAVCDRAAADAATLVAWEMQVNGDPFPVELMGFTIE